MNRQQDQGVRTAAKTARASFRKDAHLCIGRRSAYGSQFWFFFQRKRTSGRRPGKYVHWQYVQLLPFNVAPWPCYRSICLSLMRDASQTNRTSCDRCYICTGCRPTFHFCKGLAFEDLPVSDNYSTGLGLHRFQTPPLEHGLVFVPAIAVSR